MSEEKPIAVIVERNRKKCPVCGERSYSRDGVHPQCSVTQADAPTKIRLAAEKKAQANKGK